MFRVCSFRLRFNAFDFQTFGQSGSRIIHHKRLYPRLQTALGSGMPVISCVSRLIDSSLQPLASLTKAAWSEKDWLWRVKSKNISCRGLEPRAEAVSIRAFTAR